VLVQEVDERSLVVALKAHHRRLARPADRRDIVFDVEQRGPAIDFRVPLTEQIQVRAVDKQDGSIGHRSREDTTTTACTKPCRDCVARGRSLRPASLSLSPQNTYVLKSSATRVLWKPFGVTSG